MEPIFSGKAVKSFESRNEKLTLPFNSLGLARLFHVLMLIFYALQDLSQSRLVCFVFIQSHVSFV